MHSFKPPLSLSPADESKSDGHLLIVHQHNLSTPAPLQFHFLDLCSFTKALFSVQFSNPPLSVEGCD